MSDLITYADDGRERLEEVDYADAECTYWGCDGGLVWGSDLDDPLWYDPDRLYPCPSCHGSGLAKDMTLW